VTRWRFLDRSWGTFTRETSLAPARLLGQPDSPATA
jgi:hypothetical protein